MEIKMTDISNFTRAFILTYLVEGKLYRSCNILPENEIIMNIASIVSILQMSKQEKNMNTEDSLEYASKVNTNIIYLMGKLDELVQNESIIMEMIHGDKYYRLNEENILIQQFMEKHEKAMRYVFHPSYQIHQNIKNIENEICKVMQDLQIQPTNDKGDFYIEEVYSLQSSTDENVYYNIYLHQNKKYSCVCPSFQYRCVQNGKIIGHCKHIESYLSGEYEQQGDLEGYIGMDTSFVSLCDERNWEKYKKESMDTLFLGCDDMKYMDKNTKYFGWIDWKYEEDESTLRVV